jgi:hypothetical protein
VPLSREALLGPLRGASGGHPHRGTDWPAIPAPCPDAPCAFRLRQSRASYARSREVSQTARETLGDGRAPTLLDVPWHILRAAAQSTRSRMSVEANLSAATIKVVITGLFLRA